MSLCPTTFWLKCDHTRDKKRRIVQCKKYPAVHQTRFPVDYGQKIHLVENIFLKIYSRCDFSEFQPFCSQGKNTALGYIHHFQPSFYRIPATESDVFHGTINKLFRLAFLRNMQLAICDCHLEAICRKGAEKDNPAGIQCAIRGTRNETPHFCDREEVMAKLNGWRRDWPVADQGKMFILINSTED